MNYRDSVLSHTTACVAVVMVSVSVLQVFTIPFAQLSTFRKKHPQCISHSAPTVPWVRLSEDVLFRIAAASSASRHAAVLHSALYGHSQIHCSLNNVIKLFPINHTPAKKIARSCDFRTTIITVHILYVCVCVINVCILLPCRS
jgi:hypothetical protein